jgi:hypothetical protein
MGGVPNTLCSVTFEVRDPSVHALHNGSHIRQHRQDRRLQSGGLGWLVAFACESEVLFLLQSIPGFERHCLNSVDSRRILAVNVSARARKKAEECMRAGYLLKDVTSYFPLN